MNPEIFQKDEICALIFEIHRRFLIVTNPLAKVMNSIAKWTNSISEVMNSIVNGTNSIAKVMNFIAI